MVGPESLFQIYKCCFCVCFFARGSFAKRSRAELTLAQRGSVTGPAGPEVAHLAYSESMDIEVRNPTEAAGRDAIAAGIRLRRYGVVTGRSRVIRLVHNNTVYVCMCEFACVCVCASACV